MDLFLANTITVIFFLAAYLLIKKHRLIRRQNSYLVALSVVVGLALSLLLIAACFAFVLAETLPAIYVHTFVYKAVFVLLVLTISWLWQVIKQQSGRKLA